MRRNLYQVYKKEDPSQVSNYCQIGYAMFLLSQSPGGAKRQISYLQSVLSPALQTRQVCFLFDEDGRVVAYLIWAYIAPDVENRILTSFHFDLHISEWNEGTSLWIVDLVAPYGHLKNVLRFVRDELFCDEQEVRYLRTNKKRSYAVKYSRDNFLGCLRSMPPAPSYCLCGQDNCQYYDVRIDNFV
jgi:hemolysin-activating ACP:hemolysin acyltransferase